jgi:hypothetical protein
LYGGEVTAMQINRSGTSINNVDLPNGKVGIGTLNPGAPLQVTDQSNPTTNAVIAADLSNSNPGASALFGDALATTGTIHGVFGQIFSSSTGASAVEGEAQANSGQTSGVQGFNFSNGDFSAGVSAVSSSSSGKTFGARAISASPNGTGVVGLNGESSVGQILIGCCRAGVWGDTSGNVFGDTALAGTADDARAIYLENNSTHVPTALMQQDAPNQFALLAGGPSNFCTIDTNPAGAHLHCPGGTASIASVDAGQRHVALYGVESPQHWFEDFGSGRLVRGAATIGLEPTFAQTVNTGSEYHVFLTPRGECRGLYISNTSATGFEVHELGGGRSNVVFDYRIVALRRGFENVRLEDMTERLAKANVPLPKAPSGPRFTTPRRPPTPSVSAQSSVATFPNRIAPQ